MESENQAKFNNLCKRSSNINATHRFYCDNKAQIENLVNRRILLILATFLTKYLNAFMIYFYKLLKFVKQPTHNRAGLDKIVREFIANIQDFIKDMDNEINKQVQKMLTTKIFYSNPEWRNFVFPSNTNADINEFMQSFARLQNNFLYKSISGLIKEGSHNKFNVQFKVNNQKMLTMKTGGNVIFAKNTGESTVGMQTN